MKDASGCPNLRLDDLAHGWGAPSAVGLLLGGQGRRLGGPKQRLVGPRGQTLLEHQLERLTPHFHERYLLIGGEGEESAPGWEALRDPVAFSNQGPLAGLLAALTVCSQEALALVPIDNPFFPPGALQAAAASLGQAEMVGFLDVDGRRQWLPGIYRSALATPLATALKGGERSLGRWLEERDTLFVPWRDAWGSAARAFTNLNTAQAATEAGYRLPSPQSGYGW